MRSTEHGSERYADGAPHGFGFFKNIMVILAVAWIGFGAMALVQPAYEHSGLVGALLVTSIGLAAMVFVGGLAFRKSVKGGADK